MLIFLSVKFSQSLKFCRSTTFGAAFSNIKFTHLDCLLFIAQQCILAATNLKDLSTTFVALQLVCKMK